MFHILFCIGTDGLIVPNTTQWMLRFKPSVNPTKIILLASATILELVWCFQAKIVSQTSIDEIHKLAASAKEHAQLCLATKKNFASFK